MQIKCKAEGCDAVFESKEPMSPNATYVCRKHAESHRKHGDTFQTAQFDPDLRRSVRAAGTEHIKKQGNHTDEFARSQEANLIREGLI